MLCDEFENGLTDYLDGTLASDAHQRFAQHAMRCPLCHDLLSEVRNTVEACTAAKSLEPSRELEARILLSTTPNTAMDCQDFEEFLTDYLDGFLPADLYHRWERHAVLCANCTELPGDVVRAIGASYVYASEELPLPVGLHERILQATSETALAREIRSSPGERLAAWLRAWLDPLISPQLATVATMLLVAVFVLTNTVSADGSISGVYSASLRLAEHASSPRNGIQEITNGLQQLVGGTTSTGGASQSDSQPKTQPKQGSAPNKGKQR